MSDSMPITAPPATDNPPSRGARPAWHGVELRHLAALAAVAREGSFRGAADSLGYVQSAVSQQLSRLEAIVGARLVDRRRGVPQVSVTEAGRLLLAHFESIAARLDAAYADIEAIRQGRAGTVGVGVTESIAARLMPPILQRLAHQFPDVNVRMDEASRQELAVKVRTGELDVAFGTLPLAEGPFESLRLMVDPYVLVAPSGSALATRGTAPDVGEIAGVPLIGGGDEASAARVQESLRAHGLEVSYLIQSGSNAAVQALVAAGIGFAIMPELAVRRDDPQTVSLPLDELVRPRVIGLYWHRERRSPRAREAFLEITDFEIRGATARDRSMESAWMEKDTRRSSLAHRKEKG